jgi:AcrR family transcriptional regulator
VPRKHPDEPTVRRSQEERSAQTRARLLAATFDCLVQLGYAGTSTPEVLRRSGISRGAMLHHFPTKADLVCAAVDYVFQRQLQEFADGFGQLDAEDITQEAIVDLLWEKLQGPSFYAWLELVVAARTDKLLLARVQEVDVRFDQAAVAIESRFFPESDDGADSSLNGNRSFIFATLTGFALRRIYVDPIRMEGCVHPLKEALARQG